MKRGYKFLEQLTADMDLLGEPCPGQPLIEIAGECRMLVENHLGVTEYSRDRIGVRVKYGIVMICGGCLELTRMTKEQLVISGRIDGVTLIRRG